MSGERHRAEVTLDDIEVMYVLSEAGPAGARIAFAQLEAKLGSLKGRRFYGTFKSGQYRACVARRPEDNPQALGLNAWVIPGGKYVREKLLNWRSRIPEIGERFVALARAYLEDPNRPSLEYYRSQSELHLLLPILSREPQGGRGGSDQALFGGRGIHGGE